MIWCGWKIKENCNVLVNQFLGNFPSKTLGCRKIKSVSRDVKWCVNASWGLKGLIVQKHCQSPVCLFISLACCKYTAYRHKCYQKNVFETSFSVARLVLWNSGGFILVCGLSAEHLCPRTRSRKLHASDVSLGKFSYQSLYRAANTILWSATDKYAAIPL